MYQIQISFKNRESELINYDQYDYRGETPEESGIERAKEIMNDYFKFVDNVIIEVFDDGLPVKYGEYKKKYLQEEGFYFKVKRLLCRTEVSDSAVLSAIRKEVEKCRCLYEK